MKAIPMKIFDSSFIFREIKEDILIFMDKKFSEYFNLNKILHSNVSLSIFS
jgi:hypothetical protein